MKKIAILQFVLTFSLLAQFNPPKIVSLENEFDFGDIIEGETVEHEFVLNNIGGDILEITRIRASCGCTAAEPTKTKLAPEETTSLKVKFDSTRRLGKQKKYVYIFSNDPETPQLRLTFKANVISNSGENSLEKPSIKLSKYNHNFGKVKEGEKLETFVEVKNIGMSKLNITQIKSSCGCAAAMLSSKMLMPNEKSELKIEFDTKNLSGQIARTVTLFSNDPEHPSRVLTLIANIEKE